MNKRLVESFQAGEMKKLSVAFRESAGKLDIVYTAQGMQDDPDLICEMLELALTELRKKS